MKKSDSTANIVTPIVQYLSRWTDFFATDGRTEWRLRDAEFETDIATFHGKFFK